MNLLNKKYLVESKPFFSQTLFTSAACCTGSVDGVCVMCVCLQQVLLLLCVNIGDRVVLSDLLQRHNNAVLRAA